MLLTLYTSRDGVGKSLLGVEIAGFHLRLFGLNPSGYNLYRCFKRNVAVFIDWNLATLLELHHG